MRQPRLASLAVSSGSMPKRLLRMGMDLSRARLDDLVAGLHVRQIEVGEGIRYEGEELIADGVPEEQDPPVVAAGEPGAVDDVRVSGQDRPEEPGIVGRVVFQVGVLDDAQVPRRQLNGGPDGRALPLVGLVEVDPDEFRVSLPELLKDVVGAVRRAIVDDDELPPQASRKLLGEHERDEFPDREALVVRGDEDAQLLEGHGSEVWGPWVPRVCCPASRGRAVPNSRGVLKPGRYEPVWCGRGAPLSSPAHRLMGGRLGDRSGAAVHGRRRGRGA